MFVSTFIHTALSPAKKGAELKKVWTGNTFRILLASPK